MADNPAVGLDYVSAHFFVSSDDEVAEKKLAKERRKLSRKTKRSKNYYKQKIKVALRHEKVFNQRKDWLHKKSMGIVDK